MAIREAVFRHLFRYRASDDDLCFLALANGEDPPPGFLARFPDCKVKVEPRSAATVSLTSPGDALQGVRHRKHGGRGRILSVTTIR